MNASSELPSVPGEHPGEGPTTDVELLSEQCLLGTLILEPSRIADAKAVLLLGEVTVPVFQDPRHQRLYECLVELHDAGETFDALTLPQALKRLDKHAVDDVGGLGYLSALPDAVPSTANVPLWLDDIRLDWQRRRLLSAATAATNTLLSDPSQLHVVAESLRRTIEETDVTPNGHGRGFSARLAARRFNLDKPPPEARPIFKLWGKVIATPGNLVTITAQAKAGKSGVVNAMLAAPMAKPGRDTLGIESANPRGLALIHIDTEQSEQHYWHQVRRAMWRADVRDLPPWFISHHLTGFSATDARRALVELVRDGAKTHGGIHSITIDGVADLIVDVNNQAETNPFVAELHETAITFGCPIICVIHLNPGTEKTRGHLGSQLERKAESNLRLEKDEHDVSQLWGDKMRGAPIPRGSVPCYAWSTEEDMHVTVQPGQDPETKRKREEIVLLRDEVFGGAVSMSWKDIVLTVKNLLTVQQRTAERKFAAMRDLGVVKKLGATLWTKNDL